MEVIWILVAVGILAGLLWVLAICLGWTVLLVWGFWPSVLGIVLGVWLWASGHDNLSVLTIICGIIAQILYIIFREKGGSLVGIIHVLFGLGTLLAIAGVLIESPEPHSWAGRILAPRFESARAGYQKLVSPENQRFEGPWTPGDLQHFRRSSDLLRRDKGFGEFVEIFAARKRGGATLDADTVRLSFHSLPQQRGLAIEGLTFIRMELIRDGHELNSVEIGRRRAGFGFDKDKEEEILQDFEKDIRGHFFERRITRLRTILTLVGIVLAALMYALEVMSERQKEKTRAFQ